MIIKMVFQISVLTPTFSNQLQKKIMSDVSPQKRASEVEEEAPEAKIAKLKADIKSSEDAQVSNGQGNETEKEAETEESGEKNGTTTVADAVDQVLNGDLQEEDDEDEEDEDYDDEEDDEDHGEQGEAEFEVSIMEKENHLIYFEAFSYRN